MRLSTRLVLLISGLLILTTTALSIVLIQSAIAELERASRRDVEAMAQLLADTDALTNDLAYRVEETVSAHMLAEAQLTAQLVRVAENDAHLPPSQINTLLKAVAEQTVLDEFRITDATGHVYLTNLNEDFTFSPNVMQQPQMHVFWNLLQGPEKVLVQTAQTRERDQQLYKYVAVAGLDGPRIVQVGAAAPYAQDLAPAAVLQYLVDRLTGQGDIAFVRVIDASNLTLAESVQPKPGYNRDLGLADWQLISQVRQASQPQSELRADVLVAAASRASREGQPLGVVLVYQTTDRLATATREAIQRGVGLTVLAGLGSLLLSFLLARSIVQPIQRLGQAAHRLARGDWEHAVPSFNINEIQDLRLAFVSMTGQLRQSYGALESNIAELRYAQRQLQDHQEHLEDQVAQRASELTHANRQLQQEVQERTETEATLSQQNAYLAALHDITVGLLGRLDLNELLEDILQRAGALMDTAHGNISLLEPNTTAMRVRVGIGVETRYVGDYTYLDEGLTGKVWRTGQPLVVADYRTWEGRKPDKLYDVFRSTVGIPLTSGAQVIGVLSLDYLEEERVFREYEVTHLQRFAQLASVALDNVRLFEAEHQRVAELEAIRAVGLSLTSNLDLSTVLQTILTNAFKVATETRDTYIYLYQEGHLTFGAALWFDGRTAPLTNPVPGGVSYQVAEAGQMIIIPDMRSHPLYVPVRDNPDWQDYIQGAITYLPLKIGERVVGVMTVGYQQPRSAPEAELHVLQLLADYAAIAIENARLFDAEHRRVVEREALYATLTDLSAELELPRLLRAVIERAVKLLNATGGDLGIYDAPQQMIEIVACYNLEQDYVGTRMALDEGAMGHVAQTGEPLAIQDYQQWEGRSIQYALSGINSILAAPLKARRRLVGVIAITDTDPHRQFSAFDQQLLNLFTPQAAIAIENAQLFEEGQRRVMELETVRQVGLSLASSLELQAVLETILASIFKLSVNIRDTYLYLYQTLETEGDRLTFQAAQWFDRREPPLREARLAGVSYQVARQGQPIIINDMQTDPLYAAVRHEPEWQAYITGAIVYLPLKIGVRVVGVLTIAYHRPRVVPENELRVLQLLGDQAAMAIENARLYTTAQQELAERRKTEAALRLAEGKFRVLVEQLPAITYSVEIPVEGRFGFTNYISPQVEGILGFTPTEWLADPTLWINLVHPEDHDWLLETVRANNVSGEPLRTEYRSLTRAGQIVWLRNQNSFLRDEAGQVRYIYGIMLDITERKRMEAELRRYQEHLEEQVAERTAKLQKEITEHQQRVTELEAARQVALSLTSSLDLAVVLKAILESVFKISTEPRDAYIYLYEADRLTFGTALWFDGRWPPPLTDPLADGLTYRAARERQVFWVSDMSTDPLYAQVRDLPEWQAYIQGAIIYLPLTIGERVVGVMTVAYHPHYPSRLSTSERRMLNLLADQAAVAIENARLYKELHALNTDLERRITARTAQLESANKELEAFSYSVAHDLRAPLRALKNYSQFLQEDCSEQLAEIGREYVQGIAESADQMDRLVTDLLNYARIGRQKTKMTLVPMGELLEQIAARLHLREHAQVSFPTDAPIIQGREVQLEQIFANLLNNAYKYRRKESVAVITVAWADRGEAWEFSVNDNGIGIRPQHFEKIFGLFQRLHTQEEYEGTGIGLAIVKKAVEEHGGRVQVQSTLGEGSMFTVIIPKQPREE